MPDASSRESVEAVMRQLVECMRGAEGRAAELFVADATVKTAHGVARGPDDITTALAALGDGGTIDLSLERVIVQGEHAVALVADGAGTRIAVCLCEVGPDGVRSMQVYTGIDAPAAMTRS